MIFIIHNGKENTELTQSMDIRRGCLGKEIYRVCKAIIRLVRVGINVFNAIQVINRLFCTSAIEGECTCIRSDISIISKVDSGTTVRIEMPVAD